MREVQKRSKAMGYEEEMKRLKKFGADFRQYRLASGLTLTDVAKRSDVSISAICNFERHGTNVSLATYAAILDAVGREPIAARKVFK